MFDYIRRISTGRFARDVTTLTVGTAAGYGLMIISSPIITRLYSPEDIGKMGLLLAFLAVAAAVASLSYHLAIVGAENDSEAAHLVVASVAFVVLSSFVGALVLYLLINYSILGYNALPEWAAFSIFPLILITGLFLTFRYWFIREREFPLIAKIVILQNGGRAVSQIAFGPAQLGWLGLWFGELIGRGIGLLKMFRESRKKLSGLIHPFHMENLTAALKRNRKFPLFTAPSSFISYLALNMPPMIIAQLHGIAPAGFFFLVQRVVKIPLVFVGHSIADVNFRKMATLIKEEPQRLPGFFFKVALMLLIIGFFPAAILILAGPFLFGLAFGQAWEISGDLAAIMAPWALCQFVSGSLNNIVFVIRRQELTLIFDVLSISGIALTYFVSMTYGLTLVQTVAVLSGCQVAAYIVLFLILSLAILVHRQRSNSAK
ncbi:MAG TPA: oligosaccharide flippase family protein [Acidobacteriota bacterium]|nr:oligosaccharide flippase family protein [Acidobacteriota bacterium]